ncbi:hypothetical protein DUI87_13925 [Hirundo rustica rustica]|uniref:Uncharacterized protein n=1 Tax=Hirundo rustica rustica TaxID=333673 RepID=A0A3M0K8R3_HIRRU|nr:hypothetical protein DUI87_13925 [Hirundo rustica rustica]
MAPVLWLPDYHCSSESQIYSRKKLSLYKALPRTVPSMYQYIFRPLAISPSLPTTPHDNKNPLQELAQECNISRLKMNFEQKQYTAQLMVLESNTEGHNKFPLQPGAEVMDRLTGGDVLQQEFQQLNVKEEKSDKE